MGEEPHGVDDDVDSFGGVEPERLVGDHLEHLRLTMDCHGVVQEIVGEETDMLVFSYDDSDLLIGDAFLKEHLYRLLYLDDHLVVVVAGG